MMGIGKSVSKTIAPILAQNKSQLSELNKAMDGVMKTAGAAGNIAGQLKPLFANVEKTVKLIDAQTALLEAVTKLNLDLGEDKDAQGKLDALKAAAQRVADENRKQADQLEDLTEEVEKAAKDGSDKGEAKKVKAATAALEKALKLIEEQNKALDEVRKALAG